jgi:cyclopropane fatty-acyl-phospholipid synthase-like methyltransferase
MAMTNIEKRFVNRERKARRNIEKVDQQLEHLDSQKIKAVLELGCGIGSVSAHLADRYQMNVYGTDFGHEQIKLARRMYPENEYLKFGVEDASNLSCKDEIYDLVISQNMFHHVPDWK